MKTPVPWMIAAASTGVACWSLLRSPPTRTVSGSDAVEDDRSWARKGGSSCDEATPSLRATRSCLGRLQVAQSALRRCRTPSDPLADEPEGADACLSDPAVVEVLERRIDAAIEGHVEAQRNLRIDARERERSAFDAWSQEALGFTADQSEWVEDYVCAARELRERTLASLDDTPPVEALQQLRAQRKELLADMEAFLGEEAYQELRAIGGIGLVADTTECP